MFMMLTKFTLEIGLMMGVMGAVVSGGCGLLDSDITSVKFDLPVKSYTFDTAQAGGTFPTASLPSISCSTAAECCTAAMAAPTLDCGTVICDAVTSTCAVTANIETPPPQQTIDLKMEVSALSGFSSQSVLDVTINKITYDIPANSLNIDLPSVELFVADQGATNTAHASARRFGTVPPITAGATLTGGAVALDPQGQEAFKEHAHKFGTPFVFMARTTVVVAGGTPVPMGAITLTIRGQLKANPGL